MKLSFHRSHQMNVKIKKPGEVRAFVFEVALGIGGEDSQVNPESGMLINLVLVDEMLTGLRKELEAKPWGSLGEVTKFALGFVEPLVRNKNLLVQELRFVEARGFKICWSGGVWKMSQVQTLQLDEELFRIEFLTSFVENKLTETLSVKTRKDLEPSNFFKMHPDVSELMVERLSTKEKNHHLA